MGKGFNKLLLPLGGVTLLECTLRLFAGCPWIKEVFLVVQESDRLEIEAIAAPYGVRLVQGGNTRQDSVSRGLEQVETPFVLVHDGARPLVSPEKILEVAEAARRNEAAILAIPIKDTVTRVSEGLITGTIPREGLWAAQTPQAFRTVLLREAIRKAAQELFEGTDEASLVERLGHRIAVVEGSERNLKVTTPMDLLIAEHIMNQRGAR
ncbi:MAG TPA: 2-C-methyl-D-erythritol 4-phosphate cytidylyltransferase [Cyanobacteria bacterium UBA8530]|nr:2-C-methyl-D-erythritol 4-phosphate cytidylyltransferase [Cyanobacteria bacterium UBA8530]